MNIVSSNIKGFGSSPKRDSLKRLLERVSPLVILIQETMCSASMACEIFLKIKPSWKCCALGAYRLSDGLLVAWGPAQSSFKHFSTVAGILIEGHFLGFPSIAREAPP